MSRHILTLTIDSIAVHIIGKGLQESVNCIMATIPHLLDTMKVNLPTSENYKKAMRQMVELNGQLERLNDAIESLEDWRVDLEREHEYDDDDTDPQYR